MFYISKDTELTPALLNKMINRFNVDVMPKMERWKSYYDSNMNISSKSYSDTSKPCSRIVTNFCKSIVNSYSGYLVGIPVSYNSDDDITDVMNILRYNDYQEEDNAFLNDCLIYGTASELMYVDEQSQVRFRRINPLTCFGIYDDSLSSDLLYFVRIYKKDEWSETNEYIVDVYDDNNIKHYSMQGANGAVMYMNEESHYFSQCPANIFYLEDEKSIFADIIDLQDAYNELLSSETDDYSAFCDAYLVLTGAVISPEDVATMKENRVIVLPENATSQWLTKNASDAQVNSILDRIQDNIYRVSQCPDFNSEAFIGNVQSGIAMRIKCTGMETRASLICNAMEKALRRRIEIICGIVSLKLGEQVFRDINIEFHRNIPTDDAQTISLVNSLKGIVSDSTLLSQIPFITDSQQEIEKINAEKKENMTLYGFNTHTEEGEDIE